MAQDRQRLLSNKQNIAQQDVTLFIVNKQGREGRRMSPKFMNSTSDDFNRTKSDHNTLSYRGYDYQSTLNKQLDPRDQIIRIPLNFEIPELQDNKQKRWAENKKQQIQFGQSQEHIEFKIHVTDWIVNVVDVVNSVAFNHLRRDNLTEKQCKAFAAKNILANIKNLCLACQNFSEQNQIKLNIFIDWQLRAAVGALLARYPQTSSKGASQRVRKAIRNINNRASDQFDFLYLHKLNFKYNQNGDYSTEIMETLNKIIGISNQTANSQSQNTFFEEYKQFCQRMANYVPQENVKFNAAAPKKGPKLFTCQPQDVLKMQLQNEKQEFYSLLVQKITAQNAEIAQQILPFLNKKKDAKQHFKLGQKIPGWVSTFNMKEVNMGKFKAKHPSVLRVLTKWGEQLLEQIQDSQHSIGSKIHKFKTGQGELIFLTAEERDALSVAVKLKLDEVQKYLNCLKQQNKMLQSRFACEYSSGKYIDRDTDVGVFSAKLQQIVGQYVFKFVNKVIHLLLGSVKQLQASWNDLHKDSKQKQQNNFLSKNDDSKVNLVVFKIGDIFRSKYKCSQTQFINVLELLYKLDEEKPKYFKIVRIKNRLDHKDNDLLINYLFKGKIICELQLSILAQESKKQKQYSAFNHFLYELKRAEFGPISELACIAAEYDPIIASFAANSQYAPQLKKIATKLVPTKLTKQITAKSPFICSVCLKLKQIFNPDFYIRTKEQSKICNDCLQMQLLLNPERKNKFIQHSLAGTQLQNVSKKIDRVFLYQPLKDKKISKETLYKNFLRRGLYMEKNRKKPQLNFFRSAISQLDNKLILSTLDKNGDINNFQKIDMLSKKITCFENYLFFDFPDEDEPVWQKCYADLKKKVEQKKKLLNRQKIIDKQSLELLLKTLNSTQQILYLSGRDGIVTLCQNYLQKNDRHLTKAKKKQNMTIGSHIKYLQLQKCGIKQINSFAISRFKSIVQLNLSYNQITTLSNASTETQFRGVGQFFSSLLESHHSFQSFNHLRKLNLAHNKLSSLDGIQNLRQLKALDLSYNNLSSTKPLDLLTGLESLNLKKNNISQFPKFNLPELNTLNISQNKIDSIRSNKMPRLKFLDLRNNKISQIENLQHSKKISELYLSGNNIKRIQNIEMLVEIEILHLSNNKIKKLDGIENFQNLKTFIISYNMIEQIENLNGLRGLANVDLSYNKIANINKLERKDEFTLLNIEGNPIQQNGIRKGDPQESKYQIVNKNMASIYE